MTIEELDSYKKTKKKLVKYNYESEKLEKILNHIRITSNYQELKENPISKIYGFERLKHELNMYHSFNLCKGRGGTIRLILSIDEELNNVKLTYVTFNHYTDFKGR